MNDANRDLSMKKRRMLLLILLVLLFFVSIPTGLLLRESRQKRLNRELIAAVNASDTRRVAGALHDRADPNAMDREDKPLTFQEQLQSILDRIRHADNSIQGTYRSVLHLAFVNNFQPEGIAPDNPDLVLLLLDHGANPNLIDSDGWTPLMCAVYEGYDDCIRILVSHHADIHARDKDGDDVLSWALQSRGGARTIRLLLQLGTDPNAQSKDGVTPLMLASIDMDADPALVQALLDGHAEVNLRDKKGRTALNQVRAALKMCQHWLNAVPASNVQNQTKRLDLSTKLGITKLKEQLLLKAGAKTGKELDAEAKH